MRFLTIILFLVSLGWRVGHSIEVDECPYFDKASQDILRKELELHNCIQDLEIVSPDNPVRAARLLHRDGFVVIKDILQEPQLSALRQRCLGEAGKIAAKDPKHIGNRGPLRYSLGAPYPSGHLLHFPEWANLVDLDPVNAALKEIFGNDRYILRGARGDFNFPGAPYQHLHSDAWPDWLTDSSPSGFSDSGRINYRQLPTHYIVVNYIVSNITALNAPIRQIPLTTNSQLPIPSILDEPLWMKRSTVCPVPAGSVIIRDPRAWHGGTPNLSDDIRCMPNIEYYSYWYRYTDSRQMTRSMPRDIYNNLSAFGQKVARDVVVLPGETVDTKIADNVAQLYANPTCYKKMGLEDSDLENLDDILANYVHDKSERSFYGRPVHEMEAKTENEQKDEL